MRAIGLGGRLAAVAAIAMASAGMGQTVLIVQNDGPPPPERKRRPRAVSRPKFSGFDPRVNRWTGKPHEHAREVARHTRQAANRGG